MARAARAILLDHFWSYSPALRCDLADPQGGPNGAVGRPHIAEPFLELLPGTTVRFWRLGKKGGQKRRPNA